MNSVKQRLFSSILNNEPDSIAEIFQTENYPWELTEEGGYTALHRSTFLDKFDLVSLMIQEMKQRLGLDSKPVIKGWINRPSNEGFTALHYASYVGNLQIIKLLKENGADAEAVNKRGQNVLHLACQGNQPASLIFFYLQENISLSSIDNVGSTPLHWACYSGSEAAFNYLITFEQNINLKDNEGLTPLHLAVVSDRPRLVRKLLQKDAITDVKDKNGKTPVDLAEQKNKTTIMSLLERHQNDWKSAMFLQNPVTFKKSRFNQISFFVLEFLVCFFEYSLNLPSLSVNSN